MDPSADAATPTSPATIIKFYAFDKLHPTSETGVALVDVGGGKGQTINDVLGAYPHIRGKIVLEDLPAVINNGVTVDKSRVDVQNHDFLHQVQPVKGAAAYLFRNVLQNWPDGACVAILKNHVEAMRGHDSRLLICDTIIPDRDSSLLETGRDLKAIKLSGMERTVSDFRQILDAAGFSLVRTYALESPMQNVIEAVLKA